MIPQCNSPNFYTIYIWLYKYKYILYIYTCLPSVVADWELVTNGDNDCSVNSEVELLFLFFLLNWLVSELLVELATPVINVVMLSCVLTHNYICTAWCTKIFVICSWVFMTSLCGPCSWHFSLVWRTVSWSCHHPQLVFDLLSQRSA